MVHAIKAGDIGCVINVLKIWMVMMQTKKTMPKYADAIFETLDLIEKYPEKLKYMHIHDQEVVLTQIEQEVFPTQLACEHHRAGECL